MLPLLSFLLSAVHWGLGQEELDFLFPFLRLTQNLLCPGLAHDNFSLYAGKKVTGAKGVRFSSVPMS